MDGEDRMIDFKTIDKAYSRGGTKSRRPPSSDPTTQVAELT